jgi:hypothetical protein
MYQSDPIGSHRRFSGCLLLTRTLYGIIHGVPSGHGSRNVTADFQQPQPHRSVGMVFIKVFVVEDALCGSSGGVISSRSLVATTHHLDLDQAVTLRAQ